MDVEPDDCDVSAAAADQTTRSAALSGRRRYGTRNRTPPAAAAASTATHISVNFDLPATSAADSDARPSSGGGDQGRCRFSRRTKSSSSSSYHMQPRRSLLGKPINYHAHRRDIKYRRMQNRIYNFLERPKDYPSISYHLVV